MAKASFSPANPHFFQPLLSGFQNQLKIPMKFFSQHIERKHEGKPITLVSDASNKTWEVKMEGHKLTNGWKQFVEAHDLRIGDFVVFRHEGDMLFHVTALGPSCCEIQYSSSGSLKENEEDCDETDLERSSKSEKNLTAKPNQSSSDLTCFSQYVTSSNLSRDEVGVPIAFAKRYSLNRSQEIVLMNEEGRSWPSELSNHSCRVKIVRGWTSFCAANNLEVGYSCKFRLLQNTEKPVFQLYSYTEVKNIQPAAENVCDITGENRFVTLTCTPNSLKLGKQHLPAIFTRLNGLVKPGKIVLVDKDNVEWSMELKVDKGSGNMYIFAGSSWKSFCETNGVSVGDSLTLELVRRDTTSLLLKFYSKVKGHKLACGQKHSHEDLQHKKPCSVSDHESKVKRIVVDTLTSIKRFRLEFETMEQKLEDALNEINSVGRKLTQQP